MITFASSKPKWYSFQPPTPAVWARVAGGVGGCAAIVAVPWLRVHWLDFTLPVLLFVVAPLVFLWAVVRIIRLAWKGY